MRTQVPISQCVHYCGFRYGHGEYHPYETYVTRLHRQEALDDIRREFIGFLLHYRPRNLGQALGVQLSRAYPLWIYPWTSLWALVRARADAGWCRTPDEIPDIITHFSEAGIPNTLIQKEYGWLHGAYQSITREGYRPEIHGYPQVKAFRGENDREAYLVLDGNHRISALSALGHRFLEVEYAPRETLSLRDLGSWWGVRSRIYSRADAAKVFNAYFSGNQQFRVHGAGIPAIVD